MANIALITNNILSDSGTAITSVLSGSGTTNYLSKFTGSTALGNSIIYDNGTAIGIGTTSPTEALDIRGTIRVSRSGVNDSGILAFGNYLNGAGYFDNGIFRSALNAISTPGNVLHIASYEALAFTSSGSAFGSQAIRMYINGTTGNVLINTTTDSGNFKLDVNGHIRADRFYPKDSNNVYIYGDTGGLSVQGAGYFYVPASGGSYFQGPVRFRSYIIDDSNSALTISGGTSGVSYFNGSIGIGTISPNNTLEVKGADGSTIQAIFQSTVGANTAYNGGIQLGNATSNQNSKITHSSAGDNTLSFISSYSGGTANKFVFAPGGTETVRFQQNGNVLIGTTTDAGYKLDVNGSSAFRNDMYIYGNYSTYWYNGTSYFQATNSSNVGTLKMTDNSSPISLQPNGGNVGIGTTSPIASLDNQGSKGTYRQRGLTTMVTDTLSANGTQARRFEIARIAIDYNDWNGVGPVEIELYEKYYSLGLRKKYSIYYGYVSNSGCHLTEMTGGGSNNFQVVIGSEVVVSGDWRYIPIYVDVKDYSQVTAIVKTNRGLTTSNPPNISEVWLDNAPSGSNISSFTADSTVYAGNLIGGNTTFSTGNFGIGTTSPSYKLDVQNGLANFGQTASVGSAFRWGSYGTAVSPDTMLCMNQLWNGSSWTILNSSYGTTAINLGSALSSPDMLFQTGSANTVATTKMLITNSGNVLIGTTTDNGAKLQVNGVSSFSGNVVMNGNNFYLGSNFGNTVLRTISSVNVQLFNNNTGATLFLDANGAVQIGQSSAVSWAYFNASGTTIYGTTTLSTLAGTGTRMVVADASGVLSTQAIPGGGITGSGTTNYISKWTGSTALGNSLIYDNGTNVGIGTNNPTNKLQVGVSESTDQLLRLSIAYDTSRSLKGGINWNDTSGTTGQISTEYDGSMVSMVFGSLYNSGYNTNRLMVIRGNGNVGIGTTSPSYKLTVQDTVNTGTIAIGNVTYPSLIYSSAISGEFRIDNRTSAGGGYISFFPNGQGSTIGTEAMRIANSSNVLIGTTTDGGYKLNVNGNGNFILGNSGYIRLQSGSGQRHGYIQSAFSNFLFSNNIYYDGSNWRYDQNGYGAQIQTETLSVGVIAFNTFASGTAGNVATIIESMRIVNNGNILMGTTTDSGYKLDVNGTSRFTNSIYLTGTNRFIASGSSSQSVALYGGSAYSDGAYFNITGNTYGASPGGGSAEFVIRTNSDSKFAMFGYNGSSWLRYMTLFGPTGNLNIGSGTTDSGYKLRIEGNTYNDGEIISVGNITTNASAYVNANAQGYNLIVYPNTTSGPNNLYSGGQVQANIYTSSNLSAVMVLPSTSQVVMAWYPSTTQGVFIDYTIWIYGGADAMRSGTFMVVNDSSGNVQYTDIATPDLNASTALATLAAANNGGVMEVTLTNGSGNVVFINTVTRYIPTMV